MPEVLSSDPVKEATDNLRQFFATEDGTKLAGKTKGLIHFVITAGNKSFSLDTRDPNGVLVKEGTESETEPDVVLTFPNDAAFLSLVEGKSSPQTAFMMGKLKLKGSMGLALKLQPVLTAAGKRLPSKL